VTGPLGEECLLLRVVCKVKVLAASPGRQEARLRGADTNSGPADIPNEVVLRAVAQRAWKTRPRRPGRPRAGRPTRRAGICIWRASAYISGSGRGQSDATLTAAILASGNCRREVRCLAHRDLDRGRERKLITLGQDWQESIARPCSGFVGELTHEPVAARRAWKAPRQVNRTRCRSDYIP